MDDRFAAIPVSNSKMLCVGGITRAETEAANGDGLDIDGRGYYLFIANERDPSEPIQILARFFTAIEAEIAARAFAPHAVA